MTALKTRTLAFAVVVTVFGGIALGAALKVWNVSSSKEPARIKAGEFAGMPSPSDIRGSYTWADIEKAFGVPAARLVEAFGAADPAGKVNALEGLYAGKLPAGIEIGTDSARLFVALYTGLPHEIEADTILPAAAIPILRAEGKAERSRIEAAAAKAWEPGAAAAPAAPAAAAEPAPKAAAEPAPKAAAPAAPAPKAPKAAEAAKTTEEHAPVVGTITGKTSFNDLTAWGFDMAKVEALLGGLGPSAQSVRDYCSAKGLSFTELKAKLQELKP